MKKMLIVLLMSLVLFSSCSKKEESNNRINPEIDNEIDNVIENSDESKNKEEIEYVLFLKVKNEPYLVSERYSVLKDPDNIKKLTEQIALEHLLSFEETLDLISAVPKGVKILNFESKDKKIYLDLSKEFILNLEKDILKTELAIASIVNTITVLDNFDGVFITIEGENIDFLNGIDMSQEFSYFDEFFFEK